MFAPLTVTARDLVDKNLPDRLTDLGPLRRQSRAPHGALHHPTRTASAPLTRSSRHRCQHHGAARGVRLPQDAAFAIGQRTCQGTKRRVSSNPLVALHPFVKRLVRRLPGWKDPIEHRVDAVAAILAGRLASKVAHVRFGDLSARGDPCPSSSVGDRSRPARRGWSGRAVRCRTRP